MVLEYLPTFARTKSSSFVGKFGIHSALAKGSSACRGLAKIDFYVLAASSSKCLRKSLRDKESRIEKKRDIPRKKLSSLQSNACPLGSGGLGVTWALGICFEPLPLYQVHVVWSDNFFLMVHVSSDGDF